MKSLYNWESDYTLRKHRCCRNPSPLVAEQLHGLIQPLVPAEHASQNNLKNWNRCRERPYQSAYKTSLEVSRAPEGYLGCNDSLTIIIRT